MCLITSYHANASSYMRFAWCFISYVLCSSLICRVSLNSQIGKPKKGKRESIKIMQTMVDDLMTEMKIRWWKSENLYQPILDGGDERTEFKRDRQGDGPASPSHIRMLGVSRRCCEDTYIVEAVEKLLEELLLGDGPFGNEMKCITTPSLSGLCYGPVHVEFYDPWTFVGRFL
jgi:hypothetical protein